MAQENRTRFAILGMLSLKPMSGYEIKKFIDNSITHFWKENFGHIYPVLSRLQSEKLVQRQPASENKKVLIKGRPESKTFAITEKGWVALRAWLVKPPAEAYFRNELLLKLFFGMHVPIETSIAAVQAEIVSCDRNLATFAAIEKNMIPQPDCSNKQFGQITLNYGKKYYEAVKEWAEETYISLQKFSKSQNDSTGR
jgi:PadR family transcriptional regulator, regulatory protein AphA